MALLSRRGWFVARELECGFKLSLSDTINTRVNLQINFQDQHEIETASVPADRRRAIRSVGCRSGGTDACNIRLAGVGDFSGHFIESEKYT